MSGVRGRLGILTEGKQGSCLFKKARKRQTLKLGDKTTGVTDTLGEIGGILERLDGNLLLIWETEVVTAIWILEMIVKKM